MKSIDFKMKTMKPFSNKCLITKDDPQEIFTYEMKLTTLR